MDMIRREVEEEGEGWVRVEMEREREGRCGVSARVRREAGKRGESVSGP
jgi:hypothetical protein